MHVVYGLVGLKTHCKLALVIRQEDDGACGTTATSAPATTTRRPAASTRTSASSPRTTTVGKDLTRLFNELSGYAIEKKFKRLLVAPLHLRKGLLKRIAGRGGRTPRRASPSGIRIKINSIVDEAIIDALYRASNAGVPIDIVGARHLRAASPAQPGPAARTSACARSSAATSSTRASSRS